MYCIEHNNGLLESLSCLMSPIFLKLIIMDLTMRRVPKYLIGIILTYSLSSFSQEIPAVPIGDQIWKTRNLNTDRFQNGELIPEAKSDAEWISAAANHQPAWCYNANDPQNGEKFGRLYNWYAVSSVNGLCPIGWHVPNDSDWRILERTLGGWEAAGGKMKTTDGWELFNKRFNGNGTNESGFFALPAGSRYFNGLFTYIGTTGAWWTSTPPERFSEEVYIRYVTNKDDVLMRIPTKLAFGLSVRCIRD